MINRERLVHSVGVLRHFINNGLGLNRAYKVSGFELSESLLSAAAYNTYVETVGNKADTLYLRIKDGLTGEVTHAYLDNIRRLSEKFDWKNKDVMLAFDYTDEDFYGDVQGFDIHGWKKSSPINGKFKFLTCSIVSDEIPEKIPLISIPIRLGHYKSYAVAYCLGLVKKYIGSILLMLFDRGFYDKDLMYELAKRGYPYLIFVPKHKDKKEILGDMKDGEGRTKIHEFRVNKNSTTYKGSTVLAFLKQIYDKRSDRKYDWVFATNLEDIELFGIIRTYKKRWRIETGFRVQDEARIKCKSKEMKIRYFLFLFQQMLQTQWVCFYKDEVSFKKFVIEMHKVCKSLVENPKRSYGKA